MPQYKLNSHNSLLLVLYLGFQFSASLLLVSLVYSPGSRMLKETAGAAAMEMRICVYVITLTCSFVGVCSSLGFKELLFQLDM